MITDPKARVVLEAELIVTRAAIDAAVEKGVDK